MTDRVPETRISGHCGPEKLKKSRHKNSWNQINQFFSWNCILAVLNFFHSSKIDFWPFLKLQEMKFGQKNYLWNWFIWFHEFFGLDFFNFSGPLWVSQTFTHMSCTHTCYMCKKMIVFVCKVCMTCWPLQNPSWTNQSIQTGL